MRAEVVGLEGSNDRVVDTRFEAVSCRKAVNLKNVVLSLKKIKSSF